ncbi:hypothetical protein BX616_003131 [Lobosporangium transversale]|uniref:PI31 proteasome regulator N-terminal-domain-containing protein n=1 Tax=Lobosporangium transversale TaxID=64571 RepID=A0A1Y2GZI0_9FUNG|nr:PI31 proteasome regulator N-terminal-domain-containing protein [Lobosporangium transversale]KAF9899264.1 hypothetical protein BX616_003131 [Lobosporangium transversale]ORZ27709.1 PI31 proteasome regulator N-terminal-domain-containing protein [Lobosporangium transversale]|eukprot:XP_021885412.1 PI31 proteasome regulator N-terminal-domain-containing protein [Lobosporangium transversale]
MSNLQQPPPEAATASNSPTNVLDCDSVLTLLQTILPKSSTASETNTEASSTASEPQNVPITILSSPYEGLAALSHALMTAVGFRLVGLGEDDTLEPSRKSIEDLSKANELPERWNTSKESYSFRYTHSNSQLTYLIKCMRLAGKLVIHGTTIETNKICSLELDVKDFTSPSYFPYTTATDLSRDPLWNAFLSRSRTNDLIGQFKIKMIQQLIPGLSKPGYQEEQPATNTNTNTDTSTSSRGDSSGNSSSTPTSGGPAGYGPGIYRDDPSTFPGIGGGVPLPGRPGFVPRPPIFGDPFSAEDPDSMGFGGGLGGFGGGRHNPFEIGRSDLDPFAGRHGGGGFGGGGMVVGPNHPMFGRPAPGPSSGSGIYGGPQPLPRGSVPPGARFDPIGPFGPGGGIGGPPGAGTAHRGPGFGRGRGAGPGSSFLGEPDNDDAPPPGYMDMYM